MSRRSWRLVALCLLGLGGLAAGCWMHRPPIGRLRAEALADSRAALVVPLATRRGAVQGVAGRWLGLGLPRAAEAEAWIERQLGGPKLETLTFDTLHAGRVQSVECLLLTPPGAPPTVTLYLASSGVRRGPGLDTEALAVYRRFSPPRRLAVLPLPAAEQRGPGWPALATADIDVLGGMGRAMALDTARAVQACRDQGWHVEALAGFSLGGLFAASITGLRGDLLADVDLYLWGAGGDLALLARESRNGLAAALRCPAAVSPRAWRRKLARLDPLTHVRGGRVARAVLVGGRADTIMPPASVAALARGLQRSGASCRVEWVEGGHLATIGAPRALERWFAW